MNFSFYVSKYENPQESHKRKLLHIHSWIVLTFTYFFPTNNPKPLWIKQTIPYRIISMCFIFSRAFKLFIYSIVMITIRIRNSLFVGLGFYYRIWWVALWLVVCSNFTTLSFFLSFRRLCCGLHCFEWK